jgi:RNA polymerase-binding transcription factor DksA
MDQKLTEELKKKLKEDKEGIEKQLESIAKKDPNLENDWDSKFPKIQGEFGGAALETGADEVEAYGNRLPVEYALELKLRDINIALEKIGKEGYGKCEKCGKNIDENRLKVYPAARICMDCQNK